MLKKRFKKFLYTIVFPYGGLVMIKLIAATYRLRLVDEKNESDTLADHGALIYASWHQRFFPGITFFSTRKRACPRTYLGRLSIIENPRWIFQLSGSCPYYRS